MRLEHSFTVPVGVDEAWRVLLDVKRMASCVPGASLETVEGDDVTGRLRITLGRTSLTYRGRASVVERDDRAHRAVIDARGRDTRGNGTAKAKLTATLVDADGATTVQVHTQLDMTGEPAHVGRGTMTDVGNRLLGEFADCVAETLAAGAVSRAVSGSGPAQQDLVGDPLPEAVLGPHLERSRPEPTEAPEERPATPSAVATLQAIGPEPSHREGNESASAAVVSRRSARLRLAEFGGLPAAAAAVVIILIRRLRER